MNIVQPPVTDVIKASVLTTRGDIVVRATGAPDRLGIGAISEILRVNAAGTDLEYVNQGQNLKDSELSASNPGIINVAAGVPTTLLTLDLGTVTDGDRFNIFGNIQSGNGINPSEFHVHLEKDSGTSTIIFNHNAAALMGSGALNVWNHLTCWTGAGKLRVTGSGTLVIRIRLISVNTNCAFAIDNVQLYAEKTF